MFCESYCQNSGEDQIVERSCEHTEQVTSYVISLKLVGDGNKSVPTDIPISYSSTFGARVLLIWATLDQKMLDTILGLLRVCPTGRQDPYDKEVNSVAKRRKNSIRN